MDAQILNKLSETFALQPDSAKVMIAGLGKTGFSIAKFLRAGNFNVLVADSRSNPPLQERLQREMPEVQLFTGGFAAALSGPLTHLLVSPGLSLQRAVFQQLIRHGVRLLSDIDLFACAAAAPVVAITGSNGKSTVTTMLGCMAEQSGINVKIGGNLGVPALELLDDAAELYVLELSSFQLERVTQLAAAVGVVLNVSADHMDRYPDLATYAAAKARVYNGNGIMVINADDTMASAMAEKGRQVLSFALDQPADFHLSASTQETYLMAQGRRLLRAGDLPLAGRHNLSNALAALALGNAIGLTEAAMLQALKNFQGLDHRMQRVAYIDGITWINDSKATNIGACIAALQGVEHKVILIAGGDAKGADMRELAPAVIAKAKAVILIGKDARLIANVLHDCVAVFFAADLYQAVERAAELAHAGESVLLSPACASLDQFENYQQRGQKFAAAVRELVA